MQTSAIAMRQRAHCRAWREHPRRCGRASDRRAIALEAPGIERVTTYQVRSVARLEHDERAVGQRLQPLDIGALDLVALVEVVADALGVQRPVDRIHVWRWAPGKLRVGGGPAQAELVESRALAL